jgi:hypothetical protein
MLQMPPQQSVPRTHASPVWMQYDPPSEQWPPLQRCEQHWSSAEHSLPAVRHAGLSGAQVAPPHLPLQQLALPPSEQPCPSDTHWAEPQKPLAPQLSEQQSVGAKHGVPSAKHLPTDDPQVWFCGSQMPEQHVEPFEQGSLNTPHDTVPSDPEASVGVDASEPVVPPAPPVDTSGAPSRIEPSPIDAPDAPPPPPLVPPPPVVPPPEPLDVPADPPLPVLEPV